MSKTITRRDLTPLDTYRRMRSDYLKKMIAYKKNRRVQLGEYVSLLFENKETVLFQIQELVHSEDLTDPAELDEYLDIYSGMLPADHELSATLFIEMDNQQVLQEILVKLKGIEHHLSLTIGGETIPAVFEEVHDDREFTTSVHYLKFPLSPSFEEQLLNGSADQLELSLKLDHPQLALESKLKPETVQSLQKDIASAS